MKLVHPEWETPVIFDDEHIPVMAIENAEYFYEMTNEEYAAFGVENCAVVRYDF